MDNSKLEERHRDELRMVGSIARMQYAYYKDVEIDEPILPLPVPCCCFGSTGVAACARP